MARGPQKQASQAVGNENRFANSREQSAQGIESTLEPQLISDIKNPQGYGAPGLAAMNTAAQQSAGGATAGAVGSGFRRAAASGNAGGFDAAAAEAARSGQREASQRAVEIQGQNEQLKQRQRASALTGLQDLYGTDLNGSLRAMGLVPETINSETNAGKSGWLQNLEGIIATLNPGYSKGGGLSFGG